MTVIISARDACCICNCDLEQVASFEKMPITLNCVSDPSSQNVAEMIWSECQNCGLVQSNSLVDLSVLYRVDHGAGTIGAIWRSHHKSFARFFLSYCDSGSVLELGGGHCELASLCLDALPALDWTNVDPSPPLNVPAGMKYIPGFFPNVEITQGITCIVHSHVMEHLYNPLSFMEAVAELLDIGGLMIFSVPNIREMVSRNYANALNFEHVYFLTEEVTEYFLGRFGFEIISTEKFLPDHSIFYSVRKVDIVDSSNVTKIKFWQKHTFLEYVDYFQRTASAIDEVVRRSDRVCFLFGAHVFSQMLLSSGLDENLFSGVLDNDKAKQGLYLNGTSLKVDDPSSLGRYRHPLVVVLAGVYTSEIITQIESINPKLEVFTYESV